VKTVSRPTSYNLPPVTRRQLAKIAKKRQASKTRALVELIREAAARELGEGREGA
jgi:hypothetical protein